jgi:signal transduction histidine kinase
MSNVGRSLGIRRSRGTLVWAAALAGPVLMTLAALPFRTYIGSAGLLFATLLVVVGVALIGGARPAIAAVVVGVVAEEGIFAHPQGQLVAHTTTDVIVLVAFVVVAAAVGILVDLLGRERDGLARLAEEQSALRRVATLVAGGAPADELFAVVAEEVGQLFPVDYAYMGRYDSEGAVTVLARWSKAGQGFAPLGSRWALGGGNVVTLVAHTGLPARVDSHAESSGAMGDATREAGFRSSAGAPIIVESRLWGVMVAGSILDEPLHQDTEERLASFTELVATAIANAESRADLAASRARIVAAADETRRAIERDLHDGAQQRLVSLGLELRAAQAAVPPELAGLEGELARVAEGLVGVQDELREMARGIHPAILAEGGLGPALKVLARRCPIPVQLDVRAEARLSQPVEVATYYVVSETLTNAAKHAHASVVHVDVERAEGVLRVRVRDDGDGGADATQGSGLVGLKDRVESLGGSIVVRSPLGGGTTLHVELPLHG